MNCSSFTTASRLRGSRSLHLVITTLCMAAAASGAPPLEVEIQEQPIAPALAIIEGMGLRGAAGLRGVAGARGVSPRVIEARPNQLGVFTPRILAAAQMPISIAVTFPEARAGARILAAVHDGGRLAEGNGFVVLTLNAARMARFTFTPDASEGIYRVTLRHGAELKTLEFWVGPEPKLAREK